MIAQGRVSTLASTVRVSDLHLFLVCIRFCNVRYMYCCYYEPRTYITSLLKYFVPDILNVEATLIAAQYARQDTHTGDTAVRCAEDSAAVGQCQT